MRGTPIGLSGSELKEMYLEEGETYQSVAKRCDLSLKTVQRYVEPLLTDEEKRIKKCEPRPSRGNRKWNAAKSVTVQQNVQPEYVPTLRERMMERDKQQGIVREPDFGGMKLEHHEYCLRGSFAQYKIDLVGKRVTLDSEAGLASFFAGALVADDIPILIRELQTLQGLMG